MHEELNLEVVRRLLSPDYLVDNRNLKWKHAPEGIYLSAKAISAFNLEKLGVTSKKEGWIGHSREVLAYGLREQQVRVTKSHPVEVVRWVKESSQASGGVYDDLVGVIDMNGKFLSLEDLERSEVESK